MLVDKSFELLGVACHLVPLTQKRNYLGKIFLKNRTASMRFLQSEAKPRSNSFIYITKSSTDRIQDITNRSLLPQAIARDHGARLSSISILTVIAY